ncbi:MAG: hypothetical protein ACTSRU_06645 [Candidatus Hodarchaeales archaeon]
MIRLVIRHTRYILQIDLAVIKSMRSDALPVKVSSIRDGIER